MTRKPETAPMGPVSANDPVLIELVLFWASANVTPAEVMESIGVAWTHSEPDWFDVRLALSSKSRGWYASAVRRAA